MRKFLRKRWGPLTAVASALLWIAGVAAGGHVYMWEEIAWAVYVIAWALLYMSASSRADWWKQLYETEKQRGLAMWS